MYDRILVPTDGSEHAERAADYGRLLAETFDATVHVLHAVEDPQLTPGIDAGPTAGDVRSRFEEVGRRGIDSIERRLGDVDVVTELVEGTPYEEILAYSDEIEADVVVMGTRGHTGLDRLLVGSTTERAVRLSDAPVLTVGPEADSEAGFRDVLVPTDGSEAVEPAIEQALNVAEAFDATFHALNVADVRSFADDEFGPGMGVDDGVLQALEEQGERATDDLADRAARRNLAVEADVVIGTPATAIREYADEQGADLIVMGTHGRTGLDRVLLGSVTEKVVRSADCPVLTVRRDGEE